MSRLPTPRLLPVTMLGMAGLLALKAAKLAQIGLLVGASATVVPAAQAVESPAPAAPAKTAAPPPPPGSLSPAPAPAQPAAAPSHAVTPTAGADPKAAEPATVSDSEMALLQDLRQRRQELDARSQELEARGSVLAAAEKKLDARLAELQTLQKSLEALEASRQQTDDANWQGLVKVYEAMKPRDAAAIFNDLDQPVLLQVVDRMKAAKAAPVLAAMQPDKARTLTSKLAALRAGRNTPPGG